MRTFLLLAGVALAAMPGTAGAATRNFGITNFSKIRIEGPFRVQVATGVAPFARATGAAAALDRLAIEVRGDTLVIRNSLSAAGGYTGNQSEAVEISVGSHDLTRLWSTGSGAVSVNRVRGLSFDLSVQGSGSAEIGTVAVDQLNVSVVGTASARLAGAAPRLTAVVRGISMLDAADLTSRDATLGVEGAATARVTVTNAAQVDAVGPATVQLSGRPACTLRLKGSASASGCR